jgi:hypothetical protein
LWLFIQEIRDALNSRPGREEPMHFVVQEIVVRQVRELMTEHKGKPRFGFGGRRRSVGKRDSPFGEHNVAAWQGYRPRVTGTVYHNEFWEPFTAFISGCTHPCKNALSAGSLRILLRQYLAISLDVE